jgi:hypothetical protein
MSTEEKRAGVKRHNMVVNESHQRSLTSKWLEVEWTNDDCETGKLCGDGLESPRSVCSAAVREQGAGARIGDVRHPPRYV